MAGKHLKSFFDSQKDTIFKSDRVKEQRTASVSLFYEKIIPILIFSLLVSSVWIVVFFMTGQSNKNMLKEASTVFYSNDSNTALKILSSENGNIKGWIKAEGTDIDNAICQTDNNSYYLNHNQQDKKSRYGAIFLSSDDSFERKGDDRNIVIFGNNMKDGSMFGSLKKYRDINFYKKNPLVQLYYNDKKENYLIFAVMLVSASSDDGNNAFYPSKSYFNNAEDFNNWFSEVGQRSLINADIEVKQSDDILTLVTVADDFEGARLVVMAKKVSDSEAAEVNTANAVVNSAIKYPKIWYSTRGLKYPY